MPHEPRASSNLTMRFTEAEREALRAEAARKEISQAELVRMAVFRFLKLPVDQARKRRGRPPGDDCPEKKVEESQ